MASSVNEQKLRRRATSRASWRPDYVRRSGALTRLGTAVDYLDWVFTAHDEVSLALVLGSHPQVGHVTVLIDLQDENPQRCAGIALAIEREVFAKRQPQPIGVVVHVEPFGTRATVMKRVASGEITAGSAGAPPPPVGGSGGPRRQRPRLT